MVLSLGPPGRLPQLVDVIKSFLARGPHPGYTDDACHAANPQTLRGLRPTGKSPSTSAESGRAKIYDRTADDFVPSGCAGPPADGV
jgi:hypothetical protein